MAPITSYQPEGQPQLNDEELRDLLAKASAPAEAPVDTKGLAESIDETKTSPDVEEEPQSSVNVNGTDLGALSKLVDSLKTTPGTGQNPPVQTTSGTENEPNEGDETPGDTGENSPETTPQSGKMTPDSFYQQLMAKYQGLVNKPQDNSDMQQAIQARNNAQLIAGLGQAGQTIGAGLTRTQANPNAFANVQAMAGQPVQDLLMKQQAEQSRVKNIESLLEKMGVARDRAQQMAEATQARRDIAADRLAAIQAGQEGKAAGKQTADQAKVTQRVDQLINGARAEPSVRLAEADAYNTQKIDAIQQKYGDLNKIPTNMLPVVVAEVAKVAKGGVPDKEELNRMMPPGVQTWLATNAGKVLNEAQAAKAKGFLKDYFDYAKDIQKNAQKQILDRYGRVLQSNKSKMDPEDYQVRNEQYLGRFGLAGQNATPGQPNAAPAPAANEERRLTKDGKTAVFDSTTKKFLRYE